MATRSGGGPFRPSERPVDRRQAPPSERPTARRPAVPQRPVDRPEEAPPSTAPRARALLGDIDSPGEQASRERAQAALLGEGRLGSEDVSIDELRRYADLAVGRHLYLRMARPGNDRSAEVLRLADLLFGLGEPRRARRILQQLFSIGRFVDIYPLELLEALERRHQGYLPLLRREAVVRNRAFLESRMFEVEAAIPFELTLGAVVWGFALQGGGSPGYCFSPGPPGRYTLEMGDEGRFIVLLVARHRGVDLLDQVRLWVEDPPDSAARW